MTDRANAIRSVEWSTEFNGVPVPCALHIWCIEDFSAKALDMGIELTFNEYCEAIQDCHDKIDSEFGVSWDSVEEALEQTIRSREVYRV